MTPHDLIAAFDVLADAPDGVKRLRELVLSLAVRGKLVAQDPGDEPAEHLLSRVAHLATSARRGARRSTSTLAGVPIQTFALPTGWAWTSVESCTAYVRRGKSPQYDDAGTVPVVSQKCVQWTGFDLSRARRISDDSVHRYDDEQFLREGDLLWNSTGLGTLGRIMPFVSSLDYSRVVVDSHVTIVRAVESNHRYLWCWLAGPDVQRVIDALSTGSTKQTELPVKVIETIPVPLPPLAEQHRIVARVDELLGLLDRLEAARATRDAVRRAARDAALAELREAPDADAVETAWSRISRHMDDLFTEPEDVTPLRQAILQLAVRGRLVPQDPREESALELVRRISSRRSKASSLKPLVPVGDHERPFDLPAGWAFVRLDDVCEIRSGVPKGRKLEGKTTVELPYLRVANVKEGYLELSVMKRIDIPVDELGRFRVLRGDVLLTEGGDWDKLGRSAVWGGEIDECVHQNHVFVARSLDSAIDSAWVSNYTNSPDGRAYFQSCSKQTTNLASINKTELRNTPFPLPPPNEQKRILKRLRSIQELCDALEARLIASSNLHRHFAHAAVHHLES